MAQTIKLEVIDPVGLYLTPTNTLVTIANHYDSDIHLLYDKKSKTQLQVRISVYFFMKIMIKIL